MQAGKALNMYISYQLEHERVSMNWFNTRSIKGVLNSIHAHNRLAGLPDFGWMLLEWRIESSAHISKILEGGIPVRIKQALYEVSNESG